MPLAWPPTVDDPWLNPQLWDTIYISGVPWGTGYPSGGGIAIRGATRFYKFDQKDAKGQDGSTPTYVGIRPKPFKLIFRIWTPEQWAYWNSAVLPFFYYSGAFHKVYPLPISHPTTAICNISSILTEEIGQPDVDEHTKMITQVIEVREFYPAQPGNAQVTPTGPNPTVGPPKPGLISSPRVAAGQAEVQGLNNQAANLISTLP